MRIASEKFLLVADRLVKANALGIKVISARVGAEVIVCPERVGRRRIRQRIKLQIIFPNLSDPIGRNPITGEGRSLNTPISTLPRGQRIIDEDIGER